MIRFAVISILVLATALTGQAMSPEGSTTVKVAGTGYDDLKNALVHSQKPTATGMIQQSTEIVELSGDLRGRVLYHVTSLSPRDDSRRSIPVRDQPGHR
jgi:hypothetical protein